MCLEIYVRAQTYVQQFIKKETMKEREERYMGLCGGKKGKGETMQDPCYEVEI